MQDITAQGIMVCIYDTGLTHDILIELKSAWVRDWQNVVTCFHSSLNRRGFDWSSFII